MLGRIILAAALGVTIACSRSEQTGMETMAEEEAAAAEAPAQEVGAGTEAGEAPARDMGAGMETGEATEEEAEGGNAPSEE